MKMNEKLEIILARKRIRRVDFAESVGITYRAFAYYMNGSRKPRKAVLEKMAEELNVTADFLSDDSIDMELTVEERFLSGITSGSGETAKFLAQTKGLFAGNSLSDADKKKLLACITEIYNDSRKTGREENEDNS